MYNYSFFILIHCFCEQIRIANMPTKIFVGRLAEGTTSDDILALFRKFGTVKECDVISTYGFVVSLIVFHFTLVLYFCSGLFPGFQLF